ncbi:MAG: GNAT family N-acetyltransferase [Erysipelotrichales bacterium]|nr:GNAT family N-acetyltransferase [Erysipelotrichales bacterium]
MIEIKEVTNRRMLKQFIDFPAKLYKDCPYFTPYLYEDEIDNLVPGKNPASKYCDFKLFMAYKDGKLVGRICGILNHFSNSKYNQKRIRFNRIDMIDDIEVTKALIKAVEDFGKENGMEEINGPLGYSDQDKEGMLTKGFDQLNTFMTFYTHEYYVEHMKKLGFNVDVTWKEYKIYIPKEVDPRLKKASQFVQKKYGFHLQKIKSKRQLTKDVIVEVLKLTNVCYANLYGYVPIDEKQMMHLADQYIPLINLDYLSLVRDQDNKLVAYGLMIPTPVRALKKHKGHLLPIGWIDFLWDLKHAKVLDMLLVAVDPQYQSSGVMSMIFEQCIENALKNGIEHAETGPELEYNTNVQSLWKMFETENHKERVCWLKKID